MSPPGLNIGKAASQTPTLVKLVNFVITSSASSSGTAPTSSHGFRTLIYSLLAHSVIPISLLILVSWFFLSLVNSTRCISPITLFCSTLKLWKTLAIPIATRTVSSLLFTKDVGVLPVKPIAKSINRILGKLLVINLEILSNLTLPRSILRAPSP